MWTISFRPEIEDDLRSGSDWYSSKRDGLGDEFIDDYWDAIDSIADRPLSFAIAANGLRPCRLSRFSYIVHFRVIDRDILIVAVMSGARDDTAFVDRGEP
jgi:hypothetical protein